MKEVIKSIGKKVWIVTTTNGTYPTLKVITSN